MQEKLKSASQKVQRAISDFNTNVNELWGDLVLSQLNDYNNLVKQAQDFAEATTRLSQTYYTHRSQDWQQNEEGQAYKDWLYEWDEAD